MSGHRITPYEVTATRKRARKEEKDHELLLASLSDSTTVDLLDVVQDHIVGAEPLVRDDKTWQLECVGVGRRKSSVSMVFAVDISGEREVIRDGSLPERPLAFTKDKKHVTRFYACALLWRSTAGTEGRLLVHSPWGRGGTRVQITKLLQRALDANLDAKTKLHSNPLVPAKMLKQFLDQAKNTKITYSKSKGIESTFGDTTSSRSTRAEMDLIVKGSDTIPFRDALQSALKASASKDSFFTIRLRNDEPPTGYSEETFDDVYIDLETGGGIKRYSMAKDTIPTVSFDQTSRINGIYFDLPSDKPDEWAERLLAGVTPILKEHLLDVPIAS